MNNRTEQVENFLQDSGWGNARRVTLAADASTRSYDRLTGKDGKTSVLMNAPVDIEANIKRFIQVTEILQKYNLSAPEIFAIDTDSGFLLIEDLGNELFAKSCLKGKQHEHQLYQNAIDVLAHLTQFDAPPELSIYDEKTYLRETGLLTDWYLPHALNGGHSPDLAAEFDALISNICEQISGHSPVLVQRDYHAENLIWLPQRQGIKRVGLLDYQDALSGHPAYDLVSLLEDARRNTSQELRETMIRRYLRATDGNAEDFLRSYSILGAQRNLKIMGIFSRLWLRDGKASYLSLMPRVWGHLRRDLRHPVLTGLKNWIDRNVPPPDAGVIGKMLSKRNAT